MDLCYHISASTEKCHIGVLLPIADKFIDFILFIYFPRTAYYLDYLC